MARYAVVDLGSNSIRLVIYEVSKRAREALDAGRVKPHERKRIFKNILDEKKVAGLSAYVEGGRLNEAGMMVAADAVAAHMKRARDLGCARIDVFATAFLRNCINAHEAKDAIEQAAGIKVCVLSAAEEAHLGYVGAGCNGRLVDSTLIDIGGGSTELTHVVDAADSRNVSIPVGSVSSYAAHVALVIPTTAEVAAIQQAYMANFKVSELATALGRGDVSTPVSAHASAAELTSTAEAEFDPASAAVVAPARASAPVAEVGLAPATSSGLAPTPSSLIKPFDYSCTRIYGIGGGSRVCLKLAVELFGPDAVDAEPSRASRPLIGVDVVSRILDFAAERPSEFAHAAVRAVPSRLHTCLPGVAIMQASMRMFGAQELVICKYGLREGYLLERML
jgi:exopolyphosphatase/pppGpp-phosphohydrolase